MATAVDRAPFELFLFHEAKLLDERRFRDWMGLFAEDGTYWVPAVSNQDSPFNQASLFYDDRDLMRTRRSHPVVRETARVKDALFAITRARAGCASIVDARGRLTGIFTDGDLRRHLDANSNLTSRRVREVMTRRPKTIGPDRLAAEALRVLREHRIDELVVVDGRRRPVGLLDVQDLLKAGF